MNEKGGRRILRNSTALIGGNVVTKLINLILVLILARMLGTLSFGLYTFAFAYVMMFMLLTQFGMNTFLVRHIATDRSRGAAAVATALPMILVFSLLTCLANNGIAWALGWTAAERGVILLFSVYLIFDSWSRFFFVVFRAYEQMKYEALVSMAERFGLLIAALLLWRAGAGLPALAASFAGVELLKAALAFFLVRRHFIPLRPAWNPHLAASLLRQSLPFALVILFATITMRIDIIMLKLFCSVETAGLYGVGRRLIESLSFLPESIVSALFPAMSVLFLRQRTEFDRTFQRALHYLLLLALPLAALLFTYAQPVIDLLFAPEFARAAIALRWLALWLGLIFLKHLLAVSLGAVGRQGTFSVIAGLTMLINVLLNLLLIPRYELLGACFATVSAEAVTTGMALLVLRRHIGLPRLGAAFPRSLLAGALFLALLFLLRGWHFMFGAVLALSLYLVALFVLRALTREDLRFLGRIPGRRGSGPRGKAAASTIRINARFLTQPISGVQRYGHELIRALDDLIAEGHPAVSGLRFELLSPRRGRLHDPALRHIPLREVGDLGGHAWEQLELPREAQGGLLFCPGNTAPLASLHLKTPVVVTVHDLSYLYFPEAYSALFRGVYRVMIPAILRRAEQVVTVSESERGAILERYPRVARRLRAMQNGGLAACHLAAAAHAADEPGTDDAPLLLYVGALNRRKNIQGILRAFEIVSRSREARLVLVGGGGPSFDNNTFAVAADVQSRVEFTGQIDDTARLIDLYGRASCLLFPSFYEASPLPPMEAMACGCPVVAGNIPALRERCGADALFCDPADPADIAAKVEALLADPGLAAEMSRRGRERAARFTWRDCATKMAAIFREILEERRHA